MLAADAPWWMGEFGNLPHNPGDRRPAYQGGKATGANASNFGQPQRSPFAAYGQPWSQGSQNGSSPLTRAPRTASPYLPPPTTGGPMPAFDQSRTQTATPYSAYAPRPNSAYQAPNPFGQAYGGTFVPGGGQGNLAYAAPSDRPPPFTQAATFGGQQFGDMGQALAMRDAFIQSLNQSRAGHAQQWGMGNPTPPPNNFGDLMQQAGNMVQGGWTNPFIPGQAQPTPPPSMGTPYGMPLAPQPAMQPELTVGAGGSPPPASAGGRGGEGFIGKRGPQDAEMRQRWIDSGMPGYDPNQMALQVITDGWSDPNQARAYRDWVRSQSGLPPVVDSRRQSTPRDEMERLKQMRTADGQIAWDHPQNAAVRARVLREIELADQRAGQRGTYEAPSPQASAQVDRRPVIWDPMAGRWINNPNGSREPGPAMAPKTDQQIAHEQARLRMENRAKSQAGGPLVMFTDGRLYPMGALSPERRRQEQAKVDKRNKDPYYGLVPR